MSNFNFKVSQEEFDNLIRLQIQGIDRLLDSGVGDLWPTFQILAMWESGYRGTIARQIVGGYTEDDDYGQSIVNTCVILYNLGCVPLAVSLAYLTEESDDPDHKTNLVIGSTCMSSKIEDQLLRASINQYGENNYIYRAPLTSLRVGKSSDEWDLGDLKNFFLIYKDLSDGLKKIQPVLQHFAAEQMATLKESMCGKPWEMN